MVKIHFTDRLFARILFWFGLIVTFSCENPLLFNKCPDCLHNEPLEAHIKARLTSYSTQGMITTVKVYEGKLEDGILLGTFEPSYSEFSFKVKLNKLYTVTATYYRYGIFYTAVDEVIPKIRYEEIFCDQPCFLVIDNELDLRIKGL